MLTAILCEQFGSDTANLSGAERRSRARGVRGGEDQKILFPDFIKEWVI